MSATKSVIPRPDADTLRRLYVDEGLSMVDIGRLFERDTKTVFHWMRKACIPTRSRGQDQRQHFKRGHKLGVGRKKSAEEIAKIRASTIADGRVPYLKNGQHWLKGAEPSANPNWKGGATPERQEFYRSPEWKAAVAYVWARDDACCRNCGLDWRTVDRAVTPTFHVHHVWSFSIRPTRVNPALLVLLCRPCHLWVHSKANVTRAWLPQEPDSDYGWMPLGELDDVAPVDLDAEIAAHRRGREAAARVWNAA